jgi:hypothetical protein
LASTFRCHVPIWIAGIVTSALVSDKRLRFFLIVVKFVLVSVAEITITPSGTEERSILKVMPPVELEEGLIIVLFFEHPIRRRKRERKKPLLFFLFICPAFILMN